MSHQVKLRVEDDRARTRLTVFFRLLLAIPHFVWLSLWSIGVFFMLVANWFATLATGTPWREAHAFNGAWLRYTVHVHAYIALLADPYPSFGPGADYPVDLELPEPAPQQRWSVLLRLPLALPAVALGAMLLFGLWDTGSTEAESFTQVGGVLSVVALLGWFAVLARGAMPRGLRDAGAYAVAYGAQVGAYLLLLTDRYPDSDPLAALDDLPAREDAIQMTVEDDLQRGRLGTGFRLLLVIPHVIWLALWGIAALAGVVANWFVALATGRPHAAMHRFLASYLRYGTKVYAYLYLLADPYPDFDGASGSYPVELSVADPQPQDRLTVFFRLVLAVPAFLLSAAYSGVALLAAVFGWIAVLARGTMPRGLRNAAALSLRYNQQTLGYVFLLTERYPYGGPTAAEPAAAPEPPVFLPPDALARV